MKRVITIRYIPDNYDSKQNSILKISVLRKSLISKNYFFVQPLAFALAQLALHFSGSHLPSLHLAGSHPSSLQFAGSHALTSDAAVSFIFAQAEADGHFEQSFDISVAAFLTSCELFCAFATSITTNAATNIPDKPKIIFFIFRFIKIIYTRQK
jgi:hypothetical protein